MENMPIIENEEDAKAHDPSKPALLKVPRESVSTMVWLAKSLQKPSGEIGKTGKAIKSLLRKPLHDPNNPALVEVSGKDAKTMVWLMKRLQKPSNDKVGKIIEALQSLKDRNSGILVIHVGPNGQAAKAGISRGDILLQYGTAEIDKPETLKLLSEGTKTSKRVTLRALRGDQEVRFEISGGPLGIAAQGLFSSAPAIH